MRRSAAAAAFAALLAGAGGCTWVELTESGTDVHPGTREDVAGCRLVGTVTANTIHRVLMKRDPDKVATELMVLARNEAAKLGGDSLVPAGPATDGRQDFSVYRCEVN